MTGTPASPAIDLRGVAKRFGAVVVLEGVDLQVPDGSVTAILGNSGSGKTTLLRLVAGFERVDAGSIGLGGKVVDGGRVFVHAQRRGVGYVPQEGALFPHLTVAGNVGFGLARRDRSRVQHLIDLVGLQGSGRRFPHQLSGGEQQRVALARALAIRPKVVLMDEPFGSLDASLRASLRSDVARILAEAGTTTIIVTHDQDEALALADQVAVLRDGHVVACDTPRRLYHDPPDVTAATFIGEANILAGRVDGLQARSALGAIPVRPGAAPAPAGSARLLLRPEQLVLHDAPRPGAAQAAVLDFQYHGHDALAHVRLRARAAESGVAANGAEGGEELLARVTAEQVLQPGQAVWVEVRGATLAWPERPGAEDWPERPGAEDWPERPTEA